MNENPINRDRISQVGIECADKVQKIVHYSYMDRFDVKLYERVGESWDGISPEEFLAYLEPKMQTLISRDELLNRLQSGKKLRVKFGIDPTGFDVHLGHLVPVMVLRQFLRAGHHVDFIIGDFTALIGDPSGRDTARLPLTKESIEANHKTYIEQISRFIDTTKLSVRYNSEWLNKISLESLLPVLQSISLSEAFQREDFRERFKNSQAVTLAEAVYGVMMGLDSVTLETDVELGGVDQLLNFQQCRAVQVQAGQTAEVICTTPILEGTSGDGKKMSKSYGNYIAAKAPISEKFGKIMSIPDSLIKSYFISFADIKMGEIEALEKAIGENPFEMKKQLASFIIGLETGSLADGHAERDAFEKKFSKSDIGESDALKISTISGTNVFDALVTSGHFESKTELRRLFEQNAVRQVLDDLIIPIEMKVDDVKGIFRIGKLRFFMFTIS